LKDDRTLRQRKEDSGGLQTRERRTYGKRGFFIGGKKMGPHSSNRRMRKKVVGPREGGGDRFRSRYFLT